MSAIAFLESGLAYFLLCILYLVMLYGLDGGIYGGIYNGGILVILHIHSNIQALAMSINVQLLQHYNKYFNNTFILSVATLHCTLDAYSAPLVSTPTSHHELIGIPLMKSISASFFSGQSCRLCSVYTILRISRVFPNATSTTSPTSVLTICPPFEISLRSARFNDNDTERHSHDLPTH